MSAILGNLPYIYTYINYLICIGPHCSATTELTKTCRVAEKGDLSLATITKVLLEMDFEYHAL